MMYEEKQQVIVVVCKLPIVQKLPVLPNSLISAICNVHVIPKQLMASSHIHIYGAFVFRIQLFSLRATLESRRVYHVYSVRHFQAYM